MGVNDLGCVWDLESASNCEDPIWLQRHGGLHEELLTQRIPAVWKEGSGHWSWAVATPYANKMDQFWNAVNLMRLPNASGDIRNRVCIMVHMKLLCKNLEIALQS